MTTHRDNTQALETRGIAHSQVISRITNTILTAIQSTRHEIGVSKPLLVNIAGVHGSLYDEIVETNLMSALLENDIPFICMLERERNKVATALSKFTKLKDIDGAIDRLHQIDLYDDFERMALIKSTDIRHTPLSGALQINFMHDNDIEFHLADSDRILVDNNPYLDTHNRQVAKSLARAEETLGERSTRWNKILKALTPSQHIALDSTKGTLTRNYDMMDELLELSKRAKLILLLSGTAHTIGTYKEDKFSPAAHTIPYLAKQAGIQCIGVDLSGSTKHVPDYHLIQEQILNTPPTPLSLNDLFDARSTSEEKNRSGQDEISFLKEEEEKIDALTLEWIKPYRHTLLDTYLQNGRDFETVIRKLVQPEPPEPHTQFER